jgi:DNA-binding response OmpR family regulator
MLVIAGREVTDALADHAAPESVDAYDDPYEALAAMGSGEWSNVVIAASYPDLDGLCRAVRRLQSGARLTVLCSAGREPEVRQLSDRPEGPGVIDDYLIYPLTGEEWRKLTAVGDQS